MSGLKDIIIFIDIVLVAYASLFWRATLAARRADADPPAFSELRNVRAIADAGSGGRGQRWWLIFFVAVLIANAILDQVPFGAALVVGAVIGALIVPLMSRVQER